MSTYDNIISEDFGEPWAIKDGLILDRHGNLVTFFDSRIPERVVASVNSCAGEPQRALTLWRTGSHFWFEQMEKISDLLKKKKYDEADSLAYALYFEAYSYAMMFENNLDKKKILE